MFKSKEAMRQKRYRERKKKEFADLITSKDQEIQSLIQHLKAKNQEHQVFLDAKDNVINDLNEAIKHRDEQINDLNVKLEEYKQANIELKEENRRSIVQIQKLTRTRSRSRY